MQIQQMCTYKPIFTIITNFTWKFRMIGKSWKTIKRKFRSRRAVGTLIVGVLYISIYVYRYNIVQ